MSDYTIPRPAAGDITDLIADDHRLFESLMRDMRDATADREAARAAFAALLIAHSEAEEEVVYPKLVRRDVIEGEEEHHGEKEHAATNEALLHLLQAKGTDTQKFDDAVEAVAEQALMRGTGARGLRAILEEVLMPVMFDTPSDDGIKQIVVTAEVVRDNVLPTIVRHEESGKRKHKRSA